MFLLIILAIVLIVILGSLKQINEYERGVKFTAGKFTKIMLPGWRIVLPIFQSYKKVDIRTKVDDVPEQEAITKDNVSVKINAVIYYKVFDASLAVLEVEDFYYATAQLAQTTMRNIVGSVTLDELLCEREKVSSQIKEIIDKETDPWGIKVENVELKDISLTDEMKRVIARAAEAEREKQAVITKSIGEKEAAENLADAARKLAESPGALHLRTLETINDVSSDQSNTIFFPIPMDVLEAVKGYSEKLKKEKPILTEEQIKKKRTRNTRIAACCFLLLLGVGVAGNWYWENSDLPAKISAVSSEKDKVLGEATYVDATTEAPKESAYFSSARVERQTARDESLEKLQNIVDSTKENDKAHINAAEKIASISDMISAENKIETLVKAKGINNCLAIINDDGTKINIIVDVKDLTDKVILQIKDIAVSQLGCSFEDVTIIQSN